jgi:RNA polymerase sigma-70 factor (ECF subfamily)
VSGDAATPERLEDPDDILVAQAQAGDVSAFDTLVRRHIVRVTRIARALLHNRADADDVVQDAFVRAYDRLYTLDVSRGGFGRWITRIVTNAGLNAIKARRVRHAEPVHLMSDLASTDVEPDEAATREEVRRRFREALGKLTPQQRLIVTLYEVEGVPTALIAEQLSMKPETVRWHLHKARGALRQALSIFRGTGDAHDD